MVTVEDGSPSPSPEPSVAPPLPNEPLPPPLPSDLPPTEDSTSQKERGGEENEAEEQEEEEEWDPAAETDLKASRTAVVEKNKSEGEGSGVTVAKGTNGWQAIWAPANNAYYFWNSETGAVTWENPLVTSNTSSSTAPPLPQEPQPPLPPSSELPPPLPGQTSSWGDAYGAPSSSSSTPHYPPSSHYPVQQPPLPSVDPDLAHLLPKGSVSTDGYQSAQFNSRTGRFTPKDFQYTPDHLAEANRAKRQEGVFFDVAEWEKRRDAEHQERLKIEAEGRKRKADDEAEGRKKITKQDMVSWDESGGVGGEKADLGATSFSATIQAEERREKGEK